MLALTVYITFVGVLVLTLLTNGSVGKMRLARLAAVLSCSAVILGVLAVGWCGQSDQGTEPAYGGRRLSQWLKDFSSGNPQLSGRAKEAISKLGTNASPWLVKAIKSPSEPDLDAAAAEAFRLLSPPGKGAIPELTDLLNQKASRMCAAIALAGIGAEGLTPLVALLTNGDWQVRFDALAALDQIRPEDAATAVPLLAARLRQDDNFKLRVLAAQGLGNLRTREEITVPALIEGLQDTNKQVVRMCAWSLGQFEKKAVAALTTLERLSRDSDPRVAEAVKTAIDKISAEPKRRPSAR